MSKQELIFVRIKACVFAFLGGTMTKSHCETYIRNISELAHTDIDKHIIEIKNLYLVN
jgi:hypothetical protein